MSLTQLRNLGIVANAGIATTKLGAGAVLQIVQSDVKGTANVPYFSTVTNGLVDTGLSASITPSSSSNKILIIISPCIFIEGVVQPTDIGSGFGIKRNATNIYSQSNLAIFDSSNIGAHMPNIVYLDSPSTTSSTTYQLQVSRYFNNGGTRVYLNRNFQGVDNSTITLIEVKGG